MEVLAVTGKPVQTRRPLPHTRQSLTHKFAIQRHEGYLTIGLHEDGTVGEIFIKMAKEGSTLSGLIQAFCRAFSIAVQYGLPLEDAVARFKGMRFEPMGSTSNPEIPEALSIVDYVARYLELNYVERAEPIVPENPRDADRDEHEDAA
jgi:ribonucleoside-diphosphate reductase alpha chain